jgi:hypothetical protein
MNRRKSSIYSIEKTVAIDDVNVDVDLTIDDITEILQDLTDEDMQKLVNTLENIAGFTSAMFVVNPPNLSAKIEFEEWYEDYAKRWNL